MEARHRGMSSSSSETPASTPTWFTLNKEDSRGARAQGRPSNRKSERHLRVHRAALRPRLPRPVLCAGPSGCEKPDKTKGPQCVQYVIWNCRIYIRIKLQLGKLWPTAVLLDHKLKKVRLGSEQYVTRRIQRTNAGLWAMRGSKRSIFLVSVHPAYPFVLL